MAKLVEWLNDLLASEGLDGTDVVQVVESVGGQLKKNQKVVEQVPNNSFESAMLGDFPKAINDAVIDSMGVHQQAGERYLNDSQVAKLVSRAVYELLRGGVGEG